MAATSKVLQIVIRAVDKATANVQGVLRSLQRLGSGALAAVRGVGSATASVIRHFTSLRAVAIGLVGVLAARGLIGSLRMTVDHLDDLGKRARDFGLPVRDLAVLEYAADLAGVEVSALAMAFKTGSQNLAEFAATGKGSASRVINAIKLDVTDAAGRVRSLVDLLPELQAKLAGKGQAERLGILGDIFGGRGSVGVDRLLQSGDFGKIRAELEALGGVFTEKQTDAAERLNDSLSRVRRAYEGIKAQFIEAIADPTEAFMNRLALRIAAIPNQVRAAAFAVNEVLVGGSRSEDARVMLERIRSSLVALLITSAKQIGQVIAIAFVDAAVLAFHAAGPTLEDFFRDLVAPVLNHLPGVEIKPSISAQLSERRGKLMTESELALLRQADALSNELAVSTGRATFTLREFWDFMDSKVGKDLADRMRAAQTKLAVLRGEGERFVRGDIERLEREMRERSERSIRGIGNAFSNTGDAIENARFRIREAAGEFDAATSAVVEFWEQNRPANQGQDAARPFADFVTNVRGQVGLLVAVLENAKAKAPEVVKTIAAKIEAMNREGRGLEARGLDASGNTAAAARLRQELAFEAERVSLVKQYGAASRELLPILERVQRVEGDRLEFDQRAADLVRKLDRAERAYSSAVQERANLVTAGTITQTEATRANEQAGRAMERLLELTRTELLALGDSTPAFANLLEGPLADVEDRLVRIRTELQGLQGVTFADGLRDGLRDVRREAEDLYSFARNAVVDIAGSISSGLASAIVDVVAGVTSLKDAFRQFAASTLRLVSELILRMLVLRAISGIASAFSGGASATTGPGANQIPDLAGPYNFPTARHGGLFTGASFARYGRGGAVFGPNLRRDIVPAWLMPGEFVLNRDAVARLGMANLLRENAGGGARGNAGGGGSTTIAVHQEITVQGGNGKLDPAAARQYREETKAAIREAMRDDPRFRQDVRAYINAGT